MPRRKKVLILWKLQLLKHILLLCLYNAYLTNVIRLIGVFIVWYLQLCAKIGLIVMSNKPELNTKYRNGVPQQLAVNAHALIFWLNEPAQYMYEAREFPFKGYFHLCRSPIVLALFI